MSYPYKVTIKGCATEVATAADKVAVRFSLVGDIYPEPVMKEILEKVLEGRGWKPVEGKPGQYEKDGPEGEKVVFDVESLVVEASASCSEEIKVDEEVEAVGDTDFDEGMRGRRPTEAEEARLKERLAARASAELQKELSGRAKEEAERRRLELERDMSDRLAAGEPERRRELNMISEEVTATALKQKTKDLGQVVGIKEDVTQDGEDYELTITITESFRSNPGSSGEEREWRGSRANPGSAPSPARWNGRTSRNSVEPIRPGYRRRERASHDRPASEGPTYRPDEPVGPRGNPGRARRNPVLVQGPGSLASGGGAVVGTLAQELGARIIRVPAFDGEFVGEDEQRLRDAFRQARDEAPSVLVLPLDSFALRRQQRDVRKAGLVTALLTELAQRDRRPDSVAVVGIADSAADLDPALLRPGRFEVVVGSPRGNPGRARRNPVLVQGSGSLASGGGAVVGTLAQELGARIIRVPAFDGEFVGEDEQRLRDAFRRARDEAPSVLVLPLDSFALRRQQRDVRKAGLVTALLTELAQRDRRPDSVAVVGIADSAADLDPALLRPGRFEVVVGSPRGNLGRRNQRPARRNELEQVMETVGVVFPHAAAAADFMSDVVSDHPNVRARRRSDMAVEISSHCDEALGAAIRNAERLGGSVAHRGSSIREREGSITRSMRGAYAASRGTTGRLASPRDQVLRELYDKVAAGADPVTIRMFEEHALQGGATPDEVRDVCRGAEASRRNPRRRSARNNAGPLRAIPRQSDGLMPVDRRTAGPNAPARHVDGDSCTRILQREDVVAREESGEGLWFDKKSRLFMCGRPAAAHVGMATLCVDHKAD